MRNAERILAAYAEAEPWKDDHDAAMRCFEMEEVIAVGNLAFQFVSYIDAAWQDLVVAGKVLYQEEEDRQISQFYRRWAEITERNLDEIKKLTQDGFEIKGVDQCLNHFEEARGVLESRVLEAEMRPIEEILTLSKGNPRPERYGK